MTYQDMVDPHITKEIWQLFYFWIWDKHIGIGLEHLVNIFVWEKTIKYHFCHRRNHIQGEIQLVPLPLAWNYTCFKDNPWGSYDPSTKFISHWHKQKYINTCIHYFTPKSQVSTWMVKIPYIWKTSTIFMPWNSRIAKAI